MNSKKTLSEIKKEMLAYRDFFGGDIPCSDRIKAAKNKKELADILWQHECLLGDMANDAISHLNNFRQRLGGLYE